MTSTTAQRALATILTVLAFAMTIPAAFGDEVSTTSTGLGAEDTTKSAEFEFTPVPTPIPLPSIKLSLDGEQHTVGGQIDESDTYRLVTSATKAAGSYLSFERRSCAPLEGVGDELDGVVPGGVVVDVDFTSTQTDVRVLLQKLDKTTGTWVDLAPAIERTLTQRSDDDSSPTINACFG